MNTHYLYALKMKGVKDLLICYLGVKEVNEVNVVAASPAGNQLTAEVTTHSY